MPTRPPPVLEGPQALEGAQAACLRLLRARDRSRAELDAALARKGYGPEVRAPVLARLAELGYLDDARFARSRAEGLLARGRLGERAVLQRLEEGHGLAPEAARAAVAAARTADGAPQGEEAAARAALQKKGLAPGPGVHLPPKDRARAARLLASRGFDEELVERLLGESPLDPSAPDD